MLAVAGLAIFNANSTGRAQTQGIDNDTYFIMLGTISKIRIISENCGIQFDSRYDADFLTVLSEHSVDLKKASEHLIKYYENEKHNMGSECYDGAKEHLATLDKIYKTSLADMQ